MAGELSLEAAVATIQEIERNHRVSEWTVAGVRVWPFARVRLGYGVSSTVLGLPYARNDRVVARAGAATRKALRAVPTIVDAARERDAPSVDALFVSDGTSILAHEGVRYERYCDPLREELAERGISSMLLVPGAHRREGFAAPVAMTQPTMDLAKLRGAARWRTSALDLPDYDRVAARLGDIGITRFLPSRRFLQVSVAMLLAMSRVAKRWLLRTRPEVVFVVDYYKLESMAFVLACSELGVPSVDVQHGLQGPFHLAYSGWAAVPAEGYDLVPDYFWVWSDREARLIDEWRPEHRHAAIVGGNPFLRMWFDRPSTRLDPARQAAEQLPSAAPPGRTVLWTLHGLETDRELDDIATAIASAPSTFRWWVRAHPINPAGARQAQAALERAGVGEFAITDGVASAPLFGLLSRVDVHVTAFSSVVMDAAALGVPSVVTDPHGLIVFSSEKDEGWIAYHPVAHVVEGINAVVAGRRAVRPETDSRGVDWAAELVSAARSGR